MLGSERRLRDKIEELVTRPDNPDDDEATIPSNNILEALTHIGFLSAIAILGWLILASPGERKFSIFF